MLIGMFLGAILGLAIALTVIVISDYTKLPGEYDEESYDCPCNTCTSLKETRETKEKK